MYGGLFGDLPSTKKSASSDSDNKKHKQEAVSSSAPSVSTSSNQTQEQQKPPNKKKQPSSVVGSLGTAGTSMAFVPTALRQRKRAHSAVGGEPRTKQVAPAKQIKVAPAKQPPTVQTIHSESGAFVVDRESDDMKQLHASVDIVNVYDPHVPNDLLAYWDRKAMERERKQLEEQAKETLLKQEKLRHQLEHEREALQKSGNLDEIVQHRLTTSRGRGRGVSNLPAWLVQKQQQEETTLGNGTPKQSIGTMRRGRTVVLSNLTAPGEVDDDLGPEVKEECEEQCGPVANVLVKDVRPMVEVHVEFCNPLHAQKAVQVFSGRMFGNRRIIAELLE